MAVRLAHDSGGPAVLKSAQVLGDDSPLEFDENGYAWVDDEEVAQKVAALHKHVTVEPAVAEPTSDEVEDEEEPAEFDAAAFVDRTPMSDVVEDLESGDYDAHLDAIEEVADRQGVQDAIEHRREA